MKTERLWELSVIVIAIVGIGFVLLLGYYTSEEMGKEGEGLKPLTFKCEKTNPTEITCNWDNCYSDQTVIALSGGYNHITNKIRGSYKFKNLESGEYYSVLSCGEKIKIGKKIVL